MDMANENVVWQVHVLENVKERLYALGAGRGVPENVAAQLQEESGALEWAIGILMKKLFVRAWLIVGEKSYVDQIFTLYPNHLVVHQHLDLMNLGATMILDPYETGTEIKEDYKKIYEYFIPHAWNGNKLSIDKIPDYLWCDRYFATGDSVDKGKRALFLEARILLEHLKENRDNKIMDWLMDLFNHVKWEEAKPV
jgi:hypothetical protein